MKIYFHALSIFLGNSVTSTNCTLHASRIFHFCLKYLDLSLMKNIGKPSCTKIVWPPEIKKLPTDDSVIAFPIIKEYPATKIEVNAIKTLIIEVIKTIHSFFVIVLIF